MQMKIHLLMTCFLTESAIQADGYYGSEPLQDKLLQLLSTLHTLRKIPFDSLDFRISLDSRYQPHAGDLKDAIHRWFPNAKEIEGRLEDYSGWKSAVASIPHDIDWVLLMANHDHVFLGERHEEFFSYLEGLSAIGGYEIAHISHWTEALGWQATKASKANLPGFQLEFFSGETIGTVAVRRATLEGWFREDFTEGKKFVRPDNPFGPSVRFAPQRQSLPMKEFFRHLDGYGHVGLSAPFASTLMPCVTMSGKVIETREYRFGNIGESEIDLLRTPTFYPKFFGSKNEISNLLYLATGYRVRTQVVQTILRLSKVAKSDKTAILLALISSPRFWRSAFGPVRSLIGWVVGGK